MKTADIQKNINTITEKAKELAVTDIRVIDKIEIGQVIRQGDIYIHAVKADHPHGRATKERQLAIGTSKGSRHILESVSANVFEGTKQPEWCTNALLGPYIALKERAFIGHPEHANVSIPAGNYQITHQMDARTLQRVKD